MTCKLLADIKKHLWTAAKWNSASAFWRSTNTSKVLHYISHRNRHSAWTPCANTTLGFQQYNREVRVCMDRPSSPGTLSQRPRPGSSWSRAGSGPGAPALPRIETAQTGQHKLPTLLWQQVNSALEGTHLGMFLLHIPSGLPLSVKTAKGSKLVSGVMGFPPARRDHELPLVPKLSQNAHSYFKREDKSKQLFLSYI